VAPSCHIPDDCIDSKRYPLFILLFGGFEDVFGDTFDGPARDAVESLVKTPYRIAELNHRG